MTCFNYNPLSIPKTLLYEEAIAFLIKLVKKRSCIDV